MWVWSSVETSWLKILILQTLAYSWNETRGKGEIAQGEYMFLGDMRATYTVLSKSDAYGTGKGKETEKKQPKRKEVNILIR